MFLPRAISPLETFQTPLRISKQLAAPYLLLEKYVDPSADPSRPFMMPLKLWKTYHGSHISQITLS